MIRAGVVAFSAYDNRFAPDEVAVVSIFTAMVRHLKEPGITARLAFEVEVSLSPYLSE